MNHILCINFCLLVVAAMVCSSRASSIHDELLNPAANAGSHVSQTEAKSNFWSRTVERQRRDAPPHRGPPHDPFNMCCKVEKTPEQSAYREKMDAVMKECMDADQSNDKGPEKMGRAVECAAKKRNMIDDAGNLQEDGIKASFQEMPLADYQKSVVDSAITTCMAEAKNAKEGPVLRQFHFCIMKEFMNACPKDQQDTSEHCNDMRAGKRPGKPGPPGP